VPARNQRPPRLAVKVCTLLAAACCATFALATGVQKLDVVDVVDSSDNLIGTADSANQGTVLRQQIEARPAYRTGEILEATPGLIVTQHSGDGKANQYFLRGFNLDHGTDLAISVDGVPVNLRTHAHGQGYSDLNFLIPEVVSGLQYQKGPYYADEGDFAAAGAAHVQLMNKLDRGIGELTAGTYGYRRAVVAGSPAAGSGNFVYAVELARNDGPWTRPDDFRKANAVLRYVQGDAQNGFNVTAMAYQGKWNSTDQIAQRAVDSGQIGRFDAIDPTDGGEARRYSLSGAWRRSHAGGLTEANAYVVSSRLNLFSDFTYFLRDPVNGDQFEQSDKRVLSGFNLKHTSAGSWGGREVENSAGLQLRSDNIAVGLFNTRAQQRLTTTRDDHVVESSAGLFFQNSLRWAEKFRTVAGLRGDFFRGDVASSNAVNSGRASDHLFSPKLSLIFGPWAKTEYYVNYGRGFHSNDLRGATITVDPATGARADKVPLLVRTSGYEVGLRTALVPHLQTSFTVFQLDFDSELLFVGDAGTTEPSRPSRRTGFEWTNLYTPTSWLQVDADVAFSRARFTNPDPAGDRVPGAVEGVATLTATIDNRGPWYGAARLRYFGPRPLIEDNTVRSHSTTLVSVRAGYKFGKQLRAQLDAFNLLNRRTSQIDYFYASRLPGEPAAGVNDVHFHPAEPRSLRIALIASF
jgi:outer membrane receptor protein involved in Fe transport